MQSKCLITLGNQGRLLLLICISLKAPCLTYSRFKRASRMDIVFLNGKWLDKDTAVVSVFDRGFMFGDSVYEVMAVYNRRIHEKEAHLSRLERSLLSTKIKSPYSRKKLSSLLEQMIEKSGISNSIIYLQVSRGVQFPRDHKIELGTEPTILITLMEKKFLEWTEIEPLNLITQADFRWSRGDIKVSSLIANVMLRNEAVSKGYDDSILIRNERVIEATSANIFLVKDGAVYTPQKSRFFLHGITRQTVLRLCEEIDLEAVERDIFKDEIFTADEIWLSSTGNILRPVRKVDDHLIGKKYPLEKSHWRKLYQQYFLDLGKAV